LGVPVENTFDFLLLIGALYPPHRRQLKNGVPKGREEQGLTAGYMASKPDFRRINMESLPSFSSYP
jgi:hypothetical protein